MRKNRLKFQLNWDNSQTGTKLLTSSRFSVLLDGERLWPVRGAENVELEMQADDLLAWLTEFWKPLSLRQTYPISAFPERPSLFRPAAESRWHDQSLEVVEREEDIVSAFEEAHDLSRCFAGYFDLPSFWLLRSGNQMLIESCPSAPFLVDFDEAQAALVDVGNEIANRLRESGFEKWFRLVSAWHSRDKGEPIALLAWAASLELEVARKFVQDGLLAAPRNVTEAANDNDELRIAARMASALPSEQIQQIVKLVCGFDSVDATKLNILANSTKACIEQQFSSHKAHQQGEAAARFVREASSLAMVEVVDVFAIVEKLGIPLHVLPVEPETLDGLAIWGGRHGPAILLNLKSQRVGGHRDARKSAAARVTLAHELCHLLLDQGHALGAVDVLNSRMPHDVERRAKAFAGELLLPGRTAASDWEKNGKPKTVSELKLFVEQLSRKYRVTKSVAAWKLEHGTQSIGVDLRNILDYAVPYR